MADKQEHKSRPKDIEIPLRASVSSQDSIDGHHVDPSYRPKLLKKSGQSFDIATSPTEDLENVSRILVLYCGGTIGMRSHGGVYVPEPNYLVPHLRLLPMFHDSKYTGIKAKMSLRQSKGEDINDATPLVMPLSKENKRVWYSVFEYEPLLDSSNMTCNDWARLATDIEENYDQYDAFVILHGTDTMAYTASALSFMLEYLGKPVILTGSQIPIFETRSDGRDNFLGALIMAGHYVIPEVMVYFHNKLLRGNRSTKSDSGAFGAFTTPNLHPLAELEIKINVRWEAVFRPRGMNRFAVHTSFCPNVGILRLFPSITEATVRGFLQPPMQGVVIQSYGAGNGPDARKDLLQVLKDASQDGLMIINITQCARGVVSTSYATGKALVDAGVLPGADMTPEAALTKLAYVLSKDNWSTEKKFMKLQTNLRGEMTVAVHDETKHVDTTIIDKLAQAMRLSSSSESERLKREVLPSLCCHAAKLGDIDMFAELLEAGAEVGIADYDGRTALHIASSEGHHEMAHFLLEKGAPVHVRDRYGHSPLDNAMRFNHHRIISDLVKTGAHLAASNTRLGLAICSVAAFDDVGGLESYYLSGADMNMTDYCKRTPLHVAAAMGRIDCVKYLLDHGASPITTDVFDRTPLDEAKLLGHSDVFKLLEEATPREHNKDQNASTSSKC